VVGGVLGSENEKWARQFVSYAVDGGLPFVHGFEEGGLGTRRGSIDLVGE
jgi:hypothetical protein